MEAIQTPPWRRRAGPYAPSIILTEAEREELEGWIRAHSTPQQLVMRARIILLAAEGKNNLAISKELGVTKDTAGRWRRRYADNGPKGLRDRPRSGRPAKFTPEQKARTLSKAVESPREIGVPFSHWNSEDLASLAIEAGILESIHPSTVWRWLNAADLKPHRWEYWLQSQDPDFEVRMKDVTATYLAAPERWERERIPTYSIDEKTSIQALERKHPDLPMRPGIVQRREHEYKRHGTCCLTAAFQVATGEVVGELTPNRPAEVFAAFLWRLFEMTPEAPKIHVVSDQLNTHWNELACIVVAMFSGVDIELSELRTGAQRRAFLTDPDKRVVFHFTPKHASWLNQVEIWFSTLARKLLNRSSFVSLEDLQEQIREFIVYYNQILAKPYRWTYTGTPCRR